MRINLTSVLVEDQDRAPRLYTDVLGFEKKAEVPLGHHRWLTVVSRDDPDGTELVLEPDEHPAATFVHGRASETGSLDLVRSRRRAGGVRAARGARRPLHAGADADGPVITAVFDDTCGNLIQIAQQS